ncbi:MAG: hypothetical protein R3314_14885, partial [Longimicrobiales bacterium]|nr:hypothetical protein [Longimicrobiales bacterium]
PTVRHGGAKGQQDGRRWVWAAALSSLAAVLALGGLVWALAGRGAEPDPVMRLSITLPESAPMSFVPGAAGNVRPSMALSADGETMVYVTRDTAGVTRLYRRRLDSFYPEPIEGTAGASAPFFSPDGAWVAFFTGTELRKVSLSDGQVVTLGPAVDAYGGTWADDGRIYYSNGQANRVLSVRATGDAEPEDTGLENLHWPDAVPGGSALIASGTGTDTIYAVDLETGRRTQVVEGGMARFVPPGTLIFLRGDELWTIPFDPDGLRTTGEALQVLAGVRHEAGYRGVGHLAAARNGVLAYVAGPYLSETRFSWVYRDGSVDPLDFPAADHHQFEISPDDSEVAVCIADDVWVYDLERGIRRRLTNDGSSCMPGWSADGRSVLFRRQGGPDGPPVGIYQQRVGGTGEMELIWRAGPDTAFTAGYAWIDNGTRLLTGVQAGGRVDLVAYDTASGAVEVLVDRSSRDYWPALSPDGRLMAYTSVESGEELVYVEPYPPTGDRVQISAEGGAEEPRWTRDGSQVVYRRGRQLLTATIATVPRLRAGRPQVIHEGDFVNVGGWSWDMTDNAGRLLLLHSRAGESSTRTVNVVFGFSEL